MRHRSASKWALRGVLGVIFLAILYVTILAAPYPLFDTAERFDRFSFHFDGPFPEALADIAHEVETRIAAMEHHRPDGSYRVFICRDPRLYALFATLTRRSSNSMAIGLSVFGNIFVNETKVRHVAANNPWGIRHSRFEGDFSEVIAHEIAHFQMVAQLGFRTATHLPPWKSEGWAEHQANLAAIRADGSHSLHDRVALLLNDAVWGRGNSLARSLFESHVLVAYLADVQGFSLTDLADEQVTEARARAEMLAWFDRQHPGR